MVDFKARLEKGLANHHEATAAKEEIRSVFGDLNQQVKDATQGKVGIARTIEPVFERESSLTDRLVGFARRPVGNQTFIIARNIQHKRKEKIAEFNEANTGYPCSLRFNDQKVEVYDRVSLEAALGDLLESPDTGKAILYLKNFEPEKPSAKG